MKKIIFSVLFILSLSVSSFCQPADLPHNTTIPHFKLSVGYNVTTVLIFPSAILQADRGERDLMIQKQSGIENVLKVKAARKDFPATNLHVFTGDGRVFVFDVVYSTEPEQTTYDLGKVISDSNSIEISKGKIKPSQKLLDRRELIHLMGKAKFAPPFFSTGVRKNKMVIKLESIYRYGNVLFFTIEIHNRSNLPYVIDFYRLYKEDKRRFRRFSLQEQDIQPICADTLTTIPGHAIVKHVFGIPQITISENQYLTLEITEFNGGRTLKMKIINRELFNAREMNN